jgi:lactate dehydrogenase-like 2-hydroxyacid dehydrogenase
MPGSRILLTRKWPSACEARLAGAYDVTLNRDDAPLSEDEIAAAMRDYDAVLCTVTDTLGPAVFADAPRARFVGNFGVGFNHIDIAAARQAGVVVVNTPGVLTDATAEIAMTLILMVARRAGEAEREVRAGEWTGWRPTHLIGTGLSGKTLGIVGMGRIGQATAARARAFGMRIAYWNRSEVETDGTRAETLADLMEMSDFVSIHVPGTGDTEGLIDLPLLERLGPQGFLVNTARGTVVDEGALIEALRRGVIAGAGLDVYAREPDVPGLLRERDDVVLLPHLGSATAETREAMGMLVANALDAFVAGREVPNRVS